MVVLMGPLSQRPWWLQSDDKLIRRATSAFATNVCQIYNEAEKAVELEIKPAAPEMR
jgi:hypothetical protein